MKLKVFKKSLWILVGLGLVLFCWPATTRQGIDHEIHLRPIPLGVKTLEFLLRDYHYRQLTRQLTRDLNSDESKVERLMQWSVSNIRPTPPGLPVVDDHISHIIIRGYGEPDQRADVFATLSTYAACDAFWKKYGSDENPLFLSFVKIDGRWTLWDTASGHAYRNSQGKLLELPAIADQAENLDPEVKEDLKNFQAPGTLRSHKQMGFQRVLFELRSLAS